TYFARKRCLTPLRRQRPAKARPQTPQGCPQGCLTPFSRLGVSAPLRVGWREKGVRHPAALPPRSPLLQLRTQRWPVDLVRAGLRQRLDEVHFHRPLVLHHLRLAVREELLLGQRLAAIDDDERDQHLAEPRIGLADRRRLADRGVIEQHLV